MKLRLLIFALMTTFLASFNTAAREERFKTQGLDVTIEFFSPNIVRVCKTPEGHTDVLKSLAVTAKPEDIDVKREKNDRTLTLSSASLSVVANLKTGGVTFLAPDGRCLLVDKDYGTQFNPINDAGRSSWNVRQAFLLDPDEQIYGLGQQQTGKFNQRGQRLQLLNRNMSICIPFIQSIKGYGLYWDNCSPTEFTDNRQEMSFSSQVGDAADYYFIYGGNADGVIAGVRRLTGEAPMYPLWTLGFWQSRERYKSPDELCDVLDFHRKNKVPIDGIIQDWQYWGCDSNWNSMAFENPRYINSINDPERSRFLPAGEKRENINPNPKIRSPKEMIDYVHSNNAHIMISVWASFGPWTKMYHRMDSLKALLNFETWPRKAGVKPYDPFNPTARDIYWSEMKRNIFDLGMDAWWLDSTEPDHFDEKESDYDTPTYLGSFRRVHNAFPLMTNKGVYEHQRAVTSDKRVFLLTRSSFFGQQAYGSHSWSGDVSSNWETMKRQIAAGLNYTLCGIPYWNTDIGGFFAWEYGNDVKNPAYQELHVRWFEWGTFQPVMRSHNSSPVTVEIFNFGSKGDWAYDAIERYTRLRYRLLPYLYSAAWEVTSAAGSIMRPLVMDFPDDERTRDLASQHLFGRNILVCPVTQPFYTTHDRKKRDGSFIGFEKIGNVSVYLPKGTDWYDFWTNECFKGGQDVIKDVPIDIMPLYVKAGTILPWGPDVQYAEEKKWDNLEIRIYPGADGEFTLYEDENDNYNYEKGISSRITFKWDDASGLLTVGPREGKFPGMLKKRNFHIVKVGIDEVAGDAESKGGKLVKYSGKAVSVGL